MVLSRGESSWGEEDAVGSKKKIKVMFGCRIALWVDEE